MSEDGREVAVRSRPVPSSIAPLIGGRDWFRDTVGEAGAAVHRLHAPGQPDLYLKHGVGDTADAVMDEMVRMRWLARHLPVPTVEGFVLEASGAWLLKSAIGDVPPTKP